MKSLFKSSIIFYLTLSLLVFLPVNTITQNAQVQNQNQNQAQKTQETQSSSQPITSLQIASLTNLGLGETVAINLINQDIKDTKIEIPQDQADIMISVDYNSPLSPYSAVICTKCNDIKESDLNDALTNYIKANNIDDLGKYLNDIEKNQSDLDLYEAVYKVLSAVAQTMHAKCKQCSLPVEEPCNKLQYRLHQYLEDIGKETKNIANAAEAFSKVKLPSSVSDVENQAIACIRDKDLAEDQKYDNAQAACKALNENKDCANFFDWVNADNSDLDLLEFSCKSEVQAVADALSNSASAISAQKNDLYQPQLNLINVINDYISYWAKETNATNEGVIKELDNYTSECTNPNSAKLFSKSAKLGLYKIPINYAYDYDDGAFDKFFYDATALVVVNDKGEPVYETDKDGNITKGVITTDKDGIPDNPYILVSVYDIMLTSCAVINQIKEKSPDLIKKLSKSALITGQNADKYVSVAQNDIRKNAQAAQSVSNSALDGWNKAQGVIGTAGMLAFFVPMIMEKIKEIRQKKVEAAREAEMAKARKAGFSDMEEFKIAKEKGFIEEFGENAGAEFERFKQAQKDGFDIKDAKEYKSYKQAKSDYPDLKPDDWNDLVKQTKPENLTDKEFSQFREAELKGDYKFNNVEEFKQFNEAGGLKEFPNTSDWKDFNKGKDMGLWDNAGEFKTVKTAFQENTFKEATKGGIKKTNAWEKFQNADVKSSKDAEFLKTRERILGKKNPELQSIVEKQQTGTSSEIPSPTYEDPALRVDPVQLEKAQEGFKSLTNDLQAEVKKTVSFDGETYFKNEEGKWTKLNEEGTEFEAIDSELEKEINDSVESGDTHEFDFEPHPVE